MKLWKQWGVLLFTWILGTLSMRVWPTINSLDLGMKPDLMSAILFKPFHYLTSLLFLIFFIYLVSYLLRKMIYECKVAFLLKRIPYEPLCLLGGLVLLYIKVFLYFPYLMLILSGVMAIYDFLSYLPKRKEEVTYVKE